MLAIFRKWIIETPYDLVSVTVATSWILNLSMAHLNRVKKLSWRKKSGQERWQMTELVIKFNKDLNCTPL